MSSDFNSVVVVAAIDVHSSDPKVLILSTNSFVVMLSLPLESDDDVKASATVVDIFRVVSLSWSEVCVNFVDCRRCVVPASDFVSCFEVDLLNIPNVSAKI